MKNLFILLLLMVISFSIKAQQITTIYLIRHAEKVLLDPSDKDPLLTVKGQKRAIDLAKKLKKQKLSAIYCTDYQRITLTAQPISEKQNVIIQIYDPKNLKSFAERVLQENQGKKVLIIGHSNTVLETIEALGEKRPIASILDNEYNYFFTVNISNEGLIEVKVERYGEENDNLKNNKVMMKKQ